MTEVSAGSRPGRPALLLALAGVALIGSLGLAWLQSASRRSLAEARPLTGSPLSVRPPRGWSAVPHAPGVYIQADDKHRALQRCVIFRYERFPRFQPPASIVRGWKWGGDALRNPPDQLHFDSWVATPMAPSTLAGWPAIEVKRRRTVRVLNQRRAVDYSYTEDRILRVACHPRGDMIAVEYVPAFEIAAGDLELMDAICNGIEFHDPALRLSGATAMKSAGVDFPVERGWTVLGPDFPEAPGVFLLGANEHDLPAWTVGVHRTWIADTRSAADVLMDHLSSLSGEPVDPARVTEWGRLDQVRLAFLSVPARPGASKPRAAYLLWRPPQDAVLLSVEGDGAAYAAALTAAETLASSLTFTAASGWTDLAAAQACGRECAGKLSQQGALPWWSGRAMQQYFLGQHGGADAARLDVREAVNRDPRRGFSGGSAYLTTYDGYSLRERWAVDGSGVAYQRSVRRAWGHESLPEMNEYRRAGSQVVTRRQGKEDGVTLSVGNRFVCPPLERLAEAWGARHGPECLIDVSSREARGVTSRLLRRLPGDKSGAVRVLVVDDFAPRGRVVVFDEDSQPRSERGPGWHLERVEPAEANRSDLLARLRRMIAD